MLTWHLPTNLNFIYQPKEDLRHLFWAGVSRSVAITLLTIFSPIYIYQTARSIDISQSSAIVLVLGYFLILSLVKLLTLIITENLSQKIGFKGTIRASIFPFAFFILTLVFAPRLPILFVASAVLWAVHSGFFWWGYHGYFVKTADEDHFGQRISEARLLERVAIVSTPFIGAVVANFLGFSALFAFSAVFMVISLILLGKDHDKRQKRDIKFREVFGLIKSHKSISLAYMGSSVEGVMRAIAWPLFLFLFFGQLISLGAIVSVSALVASFFALAAGKWVDRQGEKTIISLGVPLTTVSWILRIAQKSLPIFVIADSIWNFGYRMVALPLNALTYKKAIEGGSARAILFRETTFIIGASLSLLILMVWIYLGGDLTGSFVIAAISATLPLVAIFRRRIHDKGE